MGEKKRRAQQGQQKEPWQQRFEVSKKCPAEMAVEIRREADRTALELSRMDNDASGRWIVNEFQAAGIVYGVWPDQDAPGGNRVAVLRGMGRLKEILEGGHPVTERVLRFLCTDYLDAELHWRVLGDGRQDPSPPTVDDLPIRQLMTLPYMPTEDRIEQAGLAQQNHDILRSVPVDQRASWLREAFGADIVFGVFPGDKEWEVKNVHVAVLKGAEIFRRPYESAEPVTATQVSILCHSLGYTEMLCWTLGDGRREGGPTFVEHPDDRPLQDDIPRAVRYDVELARAPDHFMPWLPRNDRFEISAPVPSARTKTSS
ncbi:hypothetical protein SAMN02799622_01850 [Methylobacterium sp. UNC378MF]|uniref:hypothetical protein n=1 Tax=Methylobacterium sp. UNC378MF TaxID=1502748 RepID=UPI0008865E0C|nr:hypothetical protein [Methylobacterium sp. UNC378MF]SDA17601.1 hypothetical protein SAMN02799622_01850 [Methylobacterium sp. UNC378MF]